jgi:hypothetical protein
MLLHGGVRCSVVSCGQYQPYTPFLGHLPATFLGEFKLVLAQS